MQRWSFNLKNGRCFPRWKATPPTHLHTRTLTHLHTHITKSWAWIFDAKFTFAPDASANDGENDVVLSFLNELEMISVDLMEMSKEIDCFRFNYRNNQLRFWAAVFFGRLAAFLATIWYLMLWKNCRNWWRKWRKWRTGEAKTIEISAFPIKISQEKIEIWSCRFLHLIGSFSGCNLMLNNMKKLQKLMTKSNENGGPAKQKRLKFSHFRWENLKNQLRFCVAVFL